MKKELRNWLALILITCKLLKVILRRPPLDNIRLFIHFCRNFPHDYGEIKGKTHGGQVLTRPGIPWDSLQAGRDMMAHVESLARDLEDRGEITPLMSDLLDAQRTAALYLQEIVAEGYGLETRLWTSAIWDAADSAEVYQRTKEHIDKALTGNYSPAFISFKVEKVSSTIATDLEDARAEKVLEDLEKIPVSQMKDILPDDPTTALIHLIVTDKGTFSTIIQRDQPIEVALCSSMARSHVEDILRGWMWLYFWHSRHNYPKMVDNLAQSMKATGDNLDQLKDALWFGPYQKMLDSQAIHDHLHLTEIPIVDNKPAIPFISWALMEPVLQELGMGYTVSGDGLWGELDQELSRRNVKRVILCPDRALALFPHHAVILGRDHDGKSIVVQDRYEVTYLPQGTLARIKTAPLRLGRFLVIEGDGLFLSSAIMQGLHALAPDQVLIRSDIRTGSSLRSVLAESMADSLTFIGHATYNWEQPERSDLSIAPLQDVPLVYLQQSLPSTCKLVTLAGCDTGLPRLSASMAGYRGIGEELLCRSAGTRIVSTLWPVDQVSTVLLILQFHRCLLSGTNSSSGGRTARVGTALRTAQDWLRRATKEELVVELRDLASLQHIETLEKEIAQMERMTLDHPFAHPYFWAPFYVLGDIE
jgi:CHAT domain-containing protein